MSNYIESIDIDLLVMPPTDPLHSLEVELTEQTASGLEKLALEAEVQGS